MNRQPLLLGVELTGTRFKCARCGRRCRVSWSSTWDEAQRELSAIRRGVAVCSECKPVTVERVDFGLFASVA